MSTLVESVFCWHMEMIHGIRVWDTVKGKVQRHVHEAAGRTKPKCTCTRSGVRQPLEGLLPVGDELATDPRRVSGKVHVEVRDGRSCATKYGTRLVWSKFCVSLKRLSWLECLCHPDQEFL